MGGPLPFEDTIRGTPHNHEKGIARMVISDKKVSFGLRRGRSDAGFRPTKEAFRKRVHLLEGVAR
jgi:hypothetical protein